MLPTTQGSIPEVVEEYPNQSIEQRTTRLANIQDLGPPDLLQLCKVSASNPEKKVTTFLYYTGVDVSNAAQVAVHLQGIAQVINFQPQLWYGKHKHFNVIQSTYCAFNAFSKMDTRVTVHIPGRIESSFVDINGDTYSADNDRLWLETYLTSLVRCILTYDDEEEDFTGQLVETRKINYFKTIEDVRYFLDAFKTLFFDGYKLGSNETIQLTTNTNNYLVDCFLKVLELTNEYDYAMKILEELHLKDPSVISLIVQVLLMKDEEVKAVQLMHDGIKLNPRDASLLTLQAKYCLDKNVLDYALVAAMRAVRSAPSEFLPWSILVKTYIANNDIENALLTLNSCPMVTHKEKFHLRRCTNIKNPNALHLPLPMDVTLDEVSTLHAEEVIAEQKQVDPALVNLPANNLKTTFSKSYELLTQIVHKTGWESLLRYRAKVFVMEDEYKKDATNSKLDISGSQHPLSTSVTNGTTQSLKSVNSGGQSKNASNSEQIIEEFKKKRLCERWLDNLFMLLYEDLRQYTMWQAEQVHFQAQQMSYEKTSLEWELLGLVAYRLRNFKEAASAFEKALAGRFSIRSSRKVLAYYQAEKAKLKNYEQSSQEKNSKLTPEFIRRSIQDIDLKLLNVCVKLSVWNHRWYNEFSPQLILALRNVIYDEGFSKVENEVDAYFSDDKNVIKKTKGTEEEKGNNGVVALMSETFQFIKTFTKDLDE
ncbi:hypothetical protein PACTADRAFT_58859 [Pachysolen tannophilus NRRL Y-2460]|uniref:Chaps family protein n=1 Tax=Pachysolen tannophilus NRRL Y-2460 TaxID=669874 RepID=A0A1E4TS22_PACTA|nr:hypothetical protein PACTADRAFT_58859 [Pachysolen tannophilus NRRL Y-2460]